MKVLFLGTPAFAVPVLKAIEQSRHTVVGVITQPDRMNGRGNKVTFCPVKEYAVNRFPIRQYEKINLNVEDVLSFHADIMVTCAYGQILKQPVLDACRYGIINVHASSLPKYRGSSPVEWAIIDGEKEIGVTIMQTALGVDTGDMILQRTIPLSGEENAAEALEKLSVLGAEMITEALDQIEKGEAVFTKQDESRATKCRMFTKEDGKIDFNKDAEAVKNFIRGINPRPGAFVTSENGRLKVLRSSVYGGDDVGTPGEIIRADGKEGLIVACGSGSIRLTRIQGEGAKPMDDTAYLLGKKLTVGSVFA